jgi:hypothetical protein
MMNAAVLRVTCDMRCLTCDCRRIASLYFTCHTVAAQRFKTPPHAAAAPVVLAAAAAAADHPGAEVQKSEWFRCSLLVTCDA